MRLYELLALERSLSNLTYSFDIVEINRKHSYRQEWSDVPYPNIEIITIHGHNVYKKVNGSTCSWLKIYLIVDSLIPHLGNPNARYLAEFMIKGTELIVYLDS